VVIFCQFTLFLLIGVMLFVYYQASGLTPPAQLDRVYPQFVWTHLPAGIAGLVIAAILAAAMSNLSAALNSLASTTVMDFYWPALKRGGGEQPAEGEMIRTGRRATVAWAVVLLAIGLVARRWGSVLEAGLSVASVLYGSLLGVFLLGVLTRRTGERSAMMGMIGGFLVMIWVKFGTSIAWTWYVVIGTVVTFTVGYTMACLGREQRDAGAENRRA
jgi:Na+/proline symporter